MKTVLVPVDFSETSLNAAAYAVKMFTGIYGVNMLLYHAYERPEHQQASIEELNKLKSRLFDIGIVKMQVLSEEGYDFEKCFERLARENKPDLVVMGITGRNKIGQAIIGSNTLKITQKNICPVLIVPPAASFTRVKNIAMTSEFTSAPSTSAVSFIKTLLSSFFAKLHILNVNPDLHVSITEEHRAIQSELENLFKGFEKEFHFFNLYDLQEAINLFVKDQHIDMIITFPKDHNWLNTIFAGTNTKKLAYQSTIPLLAIHS
jgi:nucleotide-binding universal stress UspA family protein